jgi:nucleoside-diphosphate-sugar epimerase
MHVFVTGATGGMGSTLIPKLLSLGHTVSGLARSSTSASKVTSLGAKAVIGDLIDLDTIAQAASDADMVIHMGFDHGQAFSGDFIGACKKDVSVIDVIGRSLTAKGVQGKTLLFASGTLGLEGDDEHSSAHRSPHMPRYESTDAAFSFVPKGLHVVQLRLAPITYGPVKPHDFIAMWAGESKKAGHVSYTEQGAWAACSYDAAADGIVAAIGRLDVLANPVSLHLVHETGIPFKEVADKLATKLDVPTKKIDREELSQLGFLGNLMGLAKPVKADYTYEVTGWRPQEAGLVAQLDKWTF